MKFRKKQSLLFGIIALVFLGVMLPVVRVVKDKIIAGRVAEAKTVEIGFRRGLAETFGNMNEAIKLSYAIDLDNTGDLGLLKKTSQRLLEENEHIVYTAYFKEDTLEYIYPAESFGSFIGKDMSDLAYSITLAKVVKTPVVEGPTHLFDEDSDIFLFIQPIYMGADYVGEVVVAMDSGYVLSSLGLDELEEGKYDYELWRVDFLGQSKTVISTSDSSVDFSDAVKHEFSLPATWNISILPKGGWITSTENTLIYLAFLIFSLSIWAIGVLLFRTYHLQRKLQIARHTNADSGLLTMDGFCFFVNKRLLKNPDTNLSVLNVQLGNFRKFTKNMEREELAKYLAMFRQSLIDCFPEETIATRVSDDSYLIAVFTSNQNPEYLIEDFLLRLHWKRRIDNNKLFINPRYCTVRYPEDGRDAPALVKEASRQFEEKFIK